MAARPEPAGVLTKAGDAGRHPLQPVPTPPATEPSPAAAPAAAPSRRIHKVQGTWRVPVDILDRLDQYAAERKRETGEGKEIIVAAALDEYLKARGV